MKTAMKAARCAAVAALLVTAADAGAQDPRIGLRAGWKDAGSAASNMELVASRERPAGFADSTQLGNILLANSDMAFQGTNLFLGSFHGFNIYDISDPRDPRLRTSVVCPGGQGDLSVYRNLLFMSVEMPNGRIDCGTGGSMAEPVSADRFRGVRIFDISDIAAPKQVAAVQTCRGSHTHSLVLDPNDTTHVYVYVAGTAGVRPPEELAGCSGRPPEEDPETSLFRIEVIHVLLSAPQDARIVNAPRIFADSGRIGGLWRGGAQAPGAQMTAMTDQCHDLTAFGELGILAGACSGNGILLDISDPENPRRTEEVFDPNFAYWHSATFNNDGTRVIFTDEWGGGMAARCRDTDRPEWGANALFEIRDGQLEHAGYYKLPAAQTAFENCVAHNGSIVPVPGRDIMVQAWYQGGISVFDFTDPAKPFEIAFFDRGPLAESLLLGGFWSAYWYNGRIYGSEIGRGLDVFRLTPGEHLTQNEIAAAEGVHQAAFNPQTQTRLTWPASYTVARAYVDQLRRGNLASVVARVATDLDEIERLAAPAERRRRLEATAGFVAGTRTGAGANATPADARRLTALAATLTELAAAQR